MKNTFLTCFMMFLCALSTIAQKIEVVKENEKIYLIDKSSSKPVKVEYNFAFPCAFSKDYILAEKKDLLLINMSTGKMIQLDEILDYLKVEGDTCKISPDQYLRFKEKNKIGILKFPDKIVLPAQYSDIYPKADVPGFFLLLKGKDWQFYNPQTGKLSISFKEINHSSLFLDNGMTYLQENDVVPVKANGNIHLIKPDGTDYMLDKFFSKKKDLNIEGMSMILSIKDGKYGYIDEHANIQVPFKFDWAELMEGTAIVKYKGKYGLLRDNGQQQIPCVYDKLVKADADVFQATKEGKTIKLLENGNPLVEMLLINENNKFIFTSEDRKITISGTFDNAKSFLCGFAPVNTAGKWGYIVPTGQIVIPYQFEDAEQFNAYGVAPAKSKGKWGIIDFTGKFICEPQFDSIDYQDKNVVKLFNNIGVYEFGSDQKIKLLVVHSEKSNFTDLRNNKIYKTVKIGSQIWMAQNLDFKTDESCYYQNNETIFGTHGRLYSWKAALKACPPGWHLPSDEDWKRLEKTLGMSDEELNATDYNRGSSLAPMFQVGGSSCFDIELTGFLHGYDKNFYKLGEVCITWTSTPSGNDYAYTRSFYQQANMLSRDNNTFVNYGLPVRCVKD